MIAKRFADMITLLRALTGLGLVGLGILAGEAALPWVVWLMIASWTGDMIDGRLARRSQVSIQTWIGKHDLEIDFFLSCGLLVYLATSGLINAWVAAIYIAIVGLVLWKLKLPRPLVMFFQNIIYVYFIWVAIKLVPNTARWILFMFAIDILATWPDFPRKAITAIISGVQEIGIFRPSEADSDQPGD